MAIALDVANLGTARNASGAGDAVSVNTGSAVASNGFIVVCVGWFGTTNLVTGVSGGSLSWTRDLNGAAASKGICIASAQAPSGLASGTTITVSWAGGAGASEMIMGASSFTGVKTSSPVDGTPLGATLASTVAWTTGNYTIAAGSLIVGGNWCDGGSANTPGTTELWELDNAGGPDGMVAAYRIEASAGGYPITGTWNAATQYIMGAVAYLAGAATADTGLAWIVA